MKRSPLINFVALLLFFGTLLALQSTLPENEADSSLLTANDEVVQVEAKKEKTPLPAEEKVPEQAKAEIPEKKEMSPTVVVKRRPPKLLEKAIELDTSEARNAYILQNNLGTPSTRSASDVYIPFENFTQDAIAHR